MIHSKYCKPRIFPWNSVRQPEQIDRAQDIGGDLTLNREKQYEIGREGVLAYKQGTPTFSYTMRQFENGDMSLFYDLSNKANPGSGEDHFVELDDMQSTNFDIAAFLTDDNNTFSGTIFFPKLRVSGFTINIGAPDAILERNFTLVGEDYKILDEKYFSYQTATKTGTGVLSMVLSPAAIEYAASTYIFKVLRIRAGVATELINDQAGSPADNTYKYVNGTATLTVQTCADGDVVKVYFPSATAYTTLWADNNVDAAFQLAECCEVYMKVGTSERIYRLQSVGIDVTFDRTDYREIGNSEFVSFGVKSKTVTISLDRYAETFSLESILAGDPAYPYIDPRNFVDNIQILVKVFADKTHTAFKIGYLMTKAAPKTMATAQPVEDYMKRTTTLECDNLKISDLASELAFI